MSNAYDADHTDAQEEEVDVLDEGPDEGLEDAVEGDGDEGQDDEAGREAGGQEASGADSEEVPSRNVSRGQRQFGQLRSENRELKERLERLERERQEDQLRSQQRQQQESAAERAERLALMDPDERTQFLLQEQSQQMERRFQQLQFQQADAQDRLEFDALCNQNSAVARIRHLVDEEKRKNPGTRRDVIAKYILGDLALKRASSAKTRQTGRAAQTQQRQAARPGAGRSDLSGREARTTNPADAARKRLQGVNLLDL